ncbi:MAG TPA: DUF5777 family beta-barrel protein [Saprospiraceae bacterium]|nr:DUF5777 family beta-barrel protein [Saprospiraceae bacterium]
MNLLSRFLSSLIIFCVLFGYEAMCQDTQSDADLLLDSETDYATASFKTNRVINLHSLENTAGGVLDFKISHRFGTIDQGFYDLFGIDAATQRIGLDYGITDRFCVGFNRNSVDKAYDGFIKYKLLKQSKGKVNMPVTLALLTSAAVKTIKFTDPRYSKATRLAYCNQLIIGRKFSDWLSLELVPTHVRRNVVLTDQEKFDVFACGIGGRLRLTRRLALTGEYIYVLPDQLAPDYKNSLSVGIDIETGGHVFQLHFTNSTSMSEYGFVTETTGKWTDSGIRFGFNVSRVFTLVNRKDKN